MSLTNRHDGRVCQRSVAVIVGAKPTDWRPCLGEDPVSTVEVLQFPLLGVGVHFDLVHRGDDLGLIEQSLQTDRQEVADADSAQLSVGKQGFQCFVGRDGLVELGRVGLVQDEQINLLEAELRRRLLKSVQRLIVSVVGDPNLGLDEDVRAVEAGTAQRLPDPFSLP